MPGDMWRPCSTPRLVRCHRQYHVQSAMLGRRSPLAVSYSTFAVLPPQWRRGDQRAITKLRHDFRDPVSMQQVRIGSLGGPDCLRSGPSDADIHASRKVCLDCSQFAWAVILLLRTRWSNWMCIFRGSDARDCDILAVRSRFPASIRPDGISGYLHVIHTDLECYICEESVGERRV